jgi:hypothetical protein
MTLAIGRITVSTDYADYTDYRLNEKINSDLNLTEGVLEMNILTDSDPRT